MSVTGRFICSTGLQYNSNKDNILHVCFEYNLQCVDHTHTTHNPQLRKSNQAPFFSVSSLWMKLHLLQVGIFLIDRMRFRLNCPGRWLFLCVPTVTKGMISNLFRIRKRQTRKQQTEMRRGFEKDYFGSRKLCEKKKSWSNCILASIKIISLTDFSMYKWMIQFPISSWWSLAYLRNWLQ